MLVIYDRQFKDGIFKYSTRERIPLNQWSNKNNMPKSGNDTLTHVLLDLQKEATNFIRLNRRTLSRESLSSYLDSLRPKEGVVVENEEPPMLLKWKQYLDSIKGTVEKGTYHNYVNSFKTFSLFMEKRSLTKTSEFSLKMFNEYRGFLIANYAPNTVARRLNNFKRIIKEISNTGFNVPFSSDYIKYKETSGIQISLTMEHLGKVSNLELVGKLNDIRWLFVMQCYTGLRISDLFRLNDNIRNDHIVIETKKVKGKSVVQPITPTVKKILDMYGNKLPKVNEQEYRKGIKEIYRMVDPDSTIQIRTKDGFENVPIWQEISSHDAVRTFITLCDQKGMKHSSIATMTGKSLSTILKHYLVKSQSFAEREMLEKW